MTYLPDLDPAALDDDKQLFAAIQQLLTTDPMQDRWQRGIWRHQGHLRKLATARALVEYGRVRSKLEAKQFDALLMVARWAFSAGRRAGPS